MSKEDWIAGLYKWSFETVKNLLVIVALTIVKNRINSITLIVLVALLQMIFSMHVTQSVISLVARAMPKPKEQRILVPMLFIVVVPVFVIVSFAIWRIDSAVTSDLLRGQSK